jgi:hypothetical protein
LTNLFILNQQTLNAVDYNSPPRAYCQREEPNNCFSRAKAHTASLTLKNARPCASAATTEARAQAPQHEETCWRALRAEHIISSARDRSKAGIALVAQRHEHAADPMLQRGSWISLSSSLVALTPIKKLDRLRYPGWSAHFLEVYFVQEEATAQDVAHR